MQKLIDELGIKCRIRSVPYPMLDIIARSMERFGDKTAKEPAFTHYGVSKLNFDFTLDITRAQDELGYQPVAVSYTHLDVYKRQSTPCAAKSTWSTTTRTMWA